MGAAIVSAVAVETRTRLSVMFESPAGRSDPLEAVVRWTRPGERRTFGVQLEPNPSSARFLLASGARIAPGIFVPEHGERVDAAPVKPLESGTGPRRGGADGPAGDAAPRLIRYEDTLPTRFGVGLKLVRRGFTFDLSAQGVGLRAADVPAAGTELWMDITLPEGRLARVEGNVAWSRPRLSGAAHADAGIRVEHADERFFLLVLDRQRAASSGIIRLR